MSEGKIVSDAIFGFITLKPHIIPIIDTPQFQRLRQIWQLGLAPFVYPTADHCRFEHSIGTYWLASRLLSQIQEQKYEDAEDKPEITNKERKCVEIAALCHDIGHGPFSHLWDRVVLPYFSKENFISHEKQFPEMWKILKGNEKVFKMLGENEIDEKCENLISALINGKVTKEFKGKEILFGIVSNSDSGMDVDKWDYLARDSSYLGHSSTNYRADIERMIFRARAIKDDEGKWKIAFRDTEAINMLRVFQLRYYMHQTAYQHRTVVAIEQMFLDGLKQCFEANIISKDNIGTPTWILENTDSIFWSNVRYSSVFKKILTRELYKPIFEASKYESVEGLSVEDLKNEVEKHLENENISHTLLRITFCKFEFGNKTGNPICLIPFYNKGKKSKIFKFKENELSSHLKLDCNESRVIVFTTSTNSDIGPAKEKLEEYFSQRQWKIQKLE